MIPSGEVSEVSERGNTMDIMEKLVTSNHPTENEDYYIAEVHMAVGNRVNAQPDYWVCRYGDDVKAYLGNSVSQERITAMIKKLESHAVGSR